MLCICYLLQVWLVGMLFVLLDKSPYMVHMSYYVSICSYGMHIGLDTHIHELL